MSLRNIFHDAQSFLKQTIKKTETIDHYENTCLLKAIQVLQKRKELLQIGKTITNMINNVKPQIITNLYNTNFCQQATTAIGK